MTANALESMQAGDILAGKYRVERVLGRGGMGMVVAAMHVDLHERRAIKFMLPMAIGDAEGIERFLREARACARLKSKHVVTVYDVGRLEGGAPYIVMELLEGSDLKDVLQERKALPVPLAVNYMLQAIEAVGEAHQAGIVHRDLKPANMFLTSGVGGAPCIKILDFGIAKLAPAPGSGADVQEMTSTTAVMGSPLYMSPEQMRASRNVDARSDIWALGVILFRMVTGTLPFQAPTAPELFAAVLKDPAPLPRSLNPGLPHGFDFILLKCLEKDPARRWSNVAELAEALRPYLSEGGPKETDATPHRWVPPPASLPDGWYGASPPRGGEAARSPAISAPAPAPLPPPSAPRPLAGPAAINPVAGPPAAGPEASPAGQTSGSWAQPTRRMDSPRTSHVLILAAALVAGALLTAMFIVFLPRGHGSGAPATASSPTAEARRPSPSVPAVKVSSAAPSVTTSAAPRVTASATPQQPAATASAEPKVGSNKAPASSSKATKPEPNPFE